LVLAGVMLVGCKGSQSTPAAANNSLGATYTSQTLTMSYPGALNAASQLMLGTLRLEGADNAITAEQAALLLPVVEALPGRVLQSDAERNAAWAFIEAHLTPAQTSAIAGMHLTQDDLSAWAQESGRGAFGPGQSGAGPQATPGAPPSSGGAFPGGRGTSPAIGTRSAQFGRGTPQAGGASRATFGGVGAGSGQDTLVLNALIRLLAQKSAGSAAPLVSSRTPNRTPAPRSLPSRTPVPTSLPSLTPTRP